MHEFRGKIAAGLAITVALFLEESLMKEGKEANSDKNIPYLAIGNNELIGQPNVKEGDWIECPHCGKSHQLQFGRDVKTGEKSQLIGFYECGDNLYVGAVNGKSLCGIVPRKRKRKR